MATKKSKTKKKAKKEPDVNKMVKSSTNKKRKKG